MVCYRYRKSHRTMPRNPRRPANRKKGYRKFIGSIRKGKRQYRQSETPATATSGDDGVVSQEQQANRFLDFDEAEYDFRGFNTNPLSPSTAMPLQQRDAHLPRIRVLSLFDGIGTGYYILSKQFDLQIDKYYSSEIDKSALRVQRHNFGDNIIPLGSVKDITSDVLNDLGRIDLLIGGSPCDQLSRVNWRRKGLNDHSGSGPLFYEYARIMKYLQEKASTAGRTLYWLFENTASMEKETLRTISTVLGSEPTQHCSSAFVPMARKRNFWGNVPELTRTRHSRNDQMHLQDYLRSYKTAVVDKLPTLTGNRSSQLSGGDKIPPVLCDGSYEFLDPNDYEILFGFPEHFTDCGLSTTTRIKLIGKSWCVPVIESLLEPLKSFFRKNS